MIISGKQVQNILKIYATQGQEPAKLRNAVSSVSKKDEVSISYESAVHQKAVQAAREAPDVRADKVEEIRQGMATGTYQVSNEDVAEKMIYRTLVDRLV